jgi:hypothetical protein
MFAQALARVIFELLTLVNKKSIIIINTILKFLITTISDESNINKEFLYSFETIIQKFGIKIDINKDIIDFINSMGAFGKDTRSRRYSSYFCCSIFRVRIILI